MEKVDGRSEVGVGRRVWQADRSYILRWAHVRFRGCRPFGFPAHGSDITATDHAETDT